MREQRQSITRRALLGVSASLSALVFVGGLAACGNTTNSAESFAPAAPASDAAPLVVLEGLPHQAFEGDLLKSELAAKATVSHGGFPFYERPVAVPSEVAAAVRSALGAPSTFMPYSGPKKCGGFHPDWFVSIGDESAAKTYLICFGCHEVIVGQGAQSSTYDIADVAYKALEASLSTLHTNRPRDE